MSRANYARLRRVLAHIDANLDSKLTVEALSDVAGLSKFHIHRQFTALYGVSMHRYVQLLRLNRAVHRLAFRDDRVTDIALESGYESLEAFVRTFNRRLGRTPSQFRKLPDLQRWTEIY